MEERGFWLERVGRLRQHSKAGRRAPHKPLLLLWSLGRFQQGLTEPVSYATAEAPLRDLLQEWGPPNLTTPSYPFRRLANDDGLWVVSTRDESIPGDQRVDLIRSDAAGALAPSFLDALRSDPALVVLIARYLLEENWPTSVHDELLADVGLDLDQIDREVVRGRLRAVSRRRDPSFRARVLMAYEHRCAVCGYDGRMDQSSVGLEAAHVRWFTYDAPDDVANGLCLCSLHHVLLDKGVLGLSPDRTVQVSKHFLAASAAARELVLVHAGAELLEPQAGEPAPADDHIGWHGREVFRGPARPDAVPSSWTPA